MADSSSWLRAMRTFWRGILACNINVSSRAHTWRYWCMRRAKPRAVCCMYLSRVSKGKMHGYRTGSVRAHVGRHSLASTRGSSSCWASLADKGPFTYRASGTADSHRSCNSRINSSAGAYDGTSSSRGSGVSSSSRSAMRYCTGYASSGSPTHLYKVALRGIGRPLASSTRCHGPCFRSMKSIFGRKKSCSDCIRTTAWTETTNEWKVAGSLAAVAGSGVRRSCTRFLSESTPPAERTHSSSDRLTTSWRHESSGACTGNSTSRSACRLSPGTRPGWRSASNTPDTCISKPVIRGIHSTRAARASRRASAWLAASIRDAIARSVLGMSLAA